MRKSKLLITILLVILNSKAAISRELFFHTLSTQEGLANDMVKEVLQDSKGFIWFGTFNGLSRYDGYHIENFYYHVNKKNSLAGNEINTLCEDHKGRIWIGSNQGISIYDPVKDKFQSLKQYTGIDHANNGFIINDIVEVRDDQLLIATRNGVDLIDVKKQSRKVLFQKENKQNPGYYDVNKIYQDKNGTIWIGTRYSFLYKMNHDYAIIDSVRLKNKDPEYINVQFNRIYDITEDEDQNLWLGTSDGLAHYQVDQKKMTYYNPGENNGIPVDDVRGITYYNNTLYLASEDGLATVKTHNMDYTIHTYDISKAGTIGGNDLYCVFIDKNQILWTGTLHSGVSSTNIDQKAFQVRGRSISTKYSPVQQYYSVISIDDNIWAGTYYGDLFKFDKQNQDYKKMHIIPYDKVTGDEICIGKIVKDPWGKLWIGTWTLWLINFDPETYKKRYFRRYENIPESLGAYSFRDMVIDSKNRLWIGSVDHGISILDLKDYYKNPEKASFLQRTYEPGDSLSISANDIQCMDIDEHDNLYIGYRHHGVDIYKIDYGRIKTLTSSDTTANSLMNNGVHVIHVSEKDPSIIWIGTESGLDRYDTKNDYFTHFTQDDGLPNNLIYGILEDQAHNLWITTADGLAKYNDTSERFETFTINDGLHGNKFSQRAYYKNPETGDFLLGGYNGITCFQPESIHQNHTPPLVNITTFKLFGEEITPGKVINGDTILKKSIAYTSKMNLSHENNFLTFEFASLHYAAPQEHKFKYKLEGFEKEWNYPAKGKNSATYTNIPPGKYTFIVNGTNHDNIWSDQPARLKLTIHPPFYQTVWFRILSLIAFISFITLIILLRTRRLRFQTGQLEKLVKKRTSSLEEAYKLLKDQQHEIVLKNQELQQHRTHLEHMVDARTSELKNALLKAEESDQLKSAFLANMSHEIRTPMNAIVGFSSLLNDEELDKQSKQMYIDLINQNSQSLLVLINDIIDLSKIQSGQIAIKFTKINLNEFLRGIYSNYQIKAREFGIDCLLDLPKNSDQYIIGTDEIRLKQVFNNLIDNAFKFTDTGYIRFGYSIENMNYLFFVEDTGIGIAKKHHTSLFKRFSKVEKNRSRIYGGTGLGLAISKSLIELLGGNIWFESEEGKGSIFYFDHPAEESGSIMVNKKDKTHEPTDYDLNILKGKKVLIAEDEKANFLLLEAILEDFDIEILRAEDGEQAVEQFAAHKDEVDFVLMDIKMPKMDGYEATRRIREINSTIPIIAQSAYAFKQEIESFYSAGIDDYIIKPINQEKLLKTIVKKLRTNRESDH